MSINQKESLYQIFMGLCNAWLRQLKAEWSRANYLYFQNRMNEPVFELLDTNRLMGQWIGGNKRILSISKDIILSKSWQFVMEILYHEMTHQYVEEILHINNETAHGETFRKICLSHGFNTSVSENMQDWDENSKVTALPTLNQKILEKIRKLLALATSNHPHEAEAAMIKAQELLLKHNLSLMDIETKRNYIYKQIGGIGGRNPKKSLIASIINKFFFVKTIWVMSYSPLSNKSGRILEIYGTQENVELAEYVHDYLHNVSEKLWVEYKMGNKIYGNRHRRTYIYGLLNGFYEKLETTIEQNKSRDLIWKGDPELIEFYRARNPRVVKCSSQYSKSSKQAYLSGKLHGSKLVIHKGIKSSNSSEKRLLTG